MFDNESETDGVDDEALFRTAEPLKLPTLTESQLSVFAFEDRLPVFCLDGTLAGEYCVSVSVCAAGLRLSAISAGSLASLSCGTRIEADVDVSFGTVWEEHSEFARQLQRRLTIEQRSGDTHWRREWRCSDQEMWEDRGSGQLDADDAPFVGEAANILLQRYWAQEDAHKRLEDGVWRALALDSRGEARRCVYTLLGHREATQPGQQQPIQLLGIRRLFLETSTSPRRCWETWLTTDGRLQLRRQIGSPLAMHPSNIANAEEPPRHSCSETAATTDLIERRSSVTGSGCLCGIMAVGGRSHSNRSRHQ